MFVIVVAAPSPFSADEWLFSLQSKCKSNSKKGRSQSSCDDVVWHFLIHASFCLLSFSSLVLCVCDTLLPTLIIACLFCVLGGSTSFHGW